MSVTRETRFMLLGGGPHLLPVLSVKDPWLLGFVCTVEPVFPIDLEQGLFPPTMRRVGNDLSIAPHHTKQELGWS